MSTDIDNDRDRIMGVPRHTSVFPPHDADADPMTLHTDHVQALPGTNEAILAGGLDG